MFLQGKLINQDATLNNFFFIDSSKFVPGSSLNLALQVFDVDKKIRFVPPSTCISTFTFNNADGTQFTQAGSFIDPLDRSLIAVALTPAQTLGNTTSLLSGNVLFTLDLLGDGTQIVTGIIYNALSRVDSTQC